MADIPSGATHETIQPGAVEVVIRQRPRPQSLVGLASIPSPINDKVGYRSPPKHSRFKKGQSGNPKGRPKGAKGVRTLSKEIFGKKFPARGPDGRKRNIASAEYVLLKLRELAHKGDFRAICKVLELYGDAVPDSAAVPIEEAEPDIADTTDNDLLDQYRAMILAEEAVKKASKGGRS